MMASAISLTLAFGFSHALQHKRILSVVSQDSDSDYLSSCGHAAAQLCLAAHRFSNQHTNKPTVA